MNNDNLGLLGKIEYPDDLRKLRVEQLEEVCSELRHVIVEELAVNPGHLASSLGVVELTETIPMRRGELYEMFDSKVKEQKRCLKNQKADT